jgi:hypothetical protein
MTPESFWGRPDDIGTGVTLRELSVMFKGHQVQQKRQMEMLAWACANIMNCWSKKSIKPKDLLPKEKGVASDYENQRVSMSPGSIGDFKAMMRRRVEDAEARSAGSDADPFVILGMREPEAIQYDEEVDFSGFGEGD